MLNSILKLSRRFTKMLASRKLTYPTLGKGKSSSNMPAGRGYVSCEAYESYISLNALTCFHSNMSYVNYTHPPSNSSCWILPEALKKKKKSKINMSPNDFCLNKISPNVSASFPSQKMDKVGPSRVQSLEPMELELHEPQQTSEIRIRISSFGDKTRFFLTEKGRGLVFFKLNYPFFLNKSKSYPFFLV